MKLSVLAPDERIVPLDVEPDELVENLKAILEVETSIPLNEQQILHHGKEIPNHGRLNAAGVVENDLLMLVSSTLSRQNGPGPSPNANPLALNSDGSAANPAAFLNHLRGDANIMSQLMQRSPEIGKAIVTGDIEVMQRFLRQQHAHQQHLRSQIDLMNADPFDIDAQRKIEEAIRQKNVDENWEAAVEHNPEAFARVIMLYVDMEVNSVPLKAFVDSGAQTTIISKDCAERCGLLRLLDRRYVGIAKGVGQSEIVGRIHVAPLKIGVNYYPCSFTVLDQPDLEFIFGLDMLRKHQCSIDLKDNVLRVGGGEIAVPFLQEKDLPLNILGSDGPPPKAVSTPVDSKTGKTVANEFAPAPVQVTSGAGGSSDLSLAQAQEAKKRARSPQDLEVKVTRLMELGFDREAVTQALSLCNGNEEQAASFLFGG
ncbi:DNA damage-inducible protein 1 [Marchantia polymorpha subsp. ruderalis]|uniref:DNA damage-inducible protein 1 n=1 Tax=Marchantia polymorpha TaxID=3197 RepID=A0A2R6X8F1_MARPO|nr:hypothetical protein MARPO_0030s0110 [Marchantia polymorpha]BBN20262.1 hypothetical protein Mp_8g17750 [Marchantia polymorpha subsp. ruderalis]|eukprot:PTQ42382.1 hypothetical protein MARPO_0030s0110 [Marchantia polymorpha]